jgi:hypothetical protein
MDVKVKDRQQEIEFIRIALNSVEIGVNYQHADLINRTLTLLMKKKGKFDIMDAITILHKWKEDWRKYFEEQSKEAS